MILQDRVAIVTGAGSGIGRGSAEIMAREGAHVVVADRREDLGRSTVERIRASGGRASHVALDVTDDAAVADLVETTMSHHGRIDILHSHVGIQVEGTLEEVEPDGMDASWQVNVRAHFMFARAIAPHMRASGGGTIVITSSNSGVQLDPGMIAYATSKHAVVAMVKQAAVDYARHNIRINALCPGWVDTPFNEPFMRQMGGRDALESYVGNQIPMGRWASVDEIAEAALFLASDRSSFMTGQALVIDGGECLV